jgi:LEA14-like dessication related protein
VALDLLVVLLTAFAGTARTHDIHVLPGTDGMTALLSGTLPTPAAGAFTGSLSLNGSPAEMPVAGVAQRTGERVAITFRILYREIPEDWASRFRIADFDYRLRGRIASGPPIDWSGTERFDEVEVEKAPDTASSRWITLDSVELTEFSLLESAARAQLTVDNPLPFPLKLASTSYRLVANGRNVGSGSTKGMIVHAAQKTSLDLPIALDHGQLLAAAGSALRSGGQVDARLQGTLVIRLPGGDIPVPLDLAGKVSLFK